MVKLLPVGFIGAGAFLTYRYGGSPDRLQQLARFWLSFSFGVALFVFRDRVPLSWVIGAVVGAAMWIVLGTAWERSIAPIATGYLVVLLGAVPLGWLRRMSSRLDLSYGIYVYGWPISQAIILIGPNMEVKNLIWVSALFAIPAAALSWLFVERPSLNARKRFCNLIACTPFLRNAAAQ